MGISQKRRDMGEDAWKQYQLERKRGNFTNYRTKRKNDICQAVAKCRRQRKLDLINYKGGCCKRCGLVSDIADIYVFHHRDPLQKDFSLGQNGCTRSLEKCIEEVDKCDLLCQNCHTIVHYNLRWNLEDNHSQVC